MLVKTLRIRKYLFSKRSKGTHFDERRDQGTEQEGKQQSKRQSKTGTPRIRLLLITAAVGSMGTFLACPHTRKRASSFPGVPGCTDLALISERVEFPNEKED